MSYAIIRNANYKKDNLAGLYKHNERKNTNYSNKDITKEKSRYNLLKLVIMLDSNFNFTFLSTLHSNTLELHRSSVRLRTTSFSLINLFGTIYNIFIKRVLKIITMCYNSYRTVEGS